MYTFWAAIKTARSAAYFKKALNSGGTGDLKDKWKNSPGFAEKVVLSGIIFGATAAIAGRTLYRSVQARHRRRKKEQANRTPYSPESARQNAERSQSFYEKQPETKKIIEKPVKKQEEPKTDDFTYDLPINNQIRNTSEKMQELKLVHSDRTNSMKFSGKQASFYVNGSGIYDKDHEPFYLRDQDDELLMIDKLINEGIDHEMTDLLNLVRSISIQ